MILADTSIWIDYIRGGDPTLSLLLNEDRILVHSFVIGELAVGNLRDRHVILRRLNALTHTATASDTEVFTFINEQRLYGLGIGYIDCHLLAAIRLTPGATIWTADRRLHAVAERLGVAAQVQRRSNGHLPSP